MTRMIAHRGLTHGPGNSLENSPNCLKRALDLGLDIEFDIRYLGGEYYLGHDKPEYRIDENFIWDTVEKYRDANFYTHCKNFATLHVLEPLTNFPNFIPFYHDRDNCILLKTGDIWAHPNMFEEAVGAAHQFRVIMVKPDLQFYIPGFAGFCSDYIFQIKIDKKNLFGEDDF